MQKRGALAKIVPILTLLVLLAFFFFSMSSNPFGPTGLVAGPAWIGQSSRIAIPADAPAIINLDAYFSSDSDIAYVATSADRITAAVAGSTLTLTPAAGFTGERTLTIYASDGESVTRKRVIVTVLAAEAGETAPAVSETPAAPAFKVEPALEQAFAAADEVDAIVLLQDVPFTFAAHSAPALKRSILEQRKQRVDAAQDALLATVNDVPAGTGDAGNGITGAAVADYDFELVREYETVNALAVRLTRTGLAKLRDDPAVAQILLDKPFQAFRAQSVPLIDADDVWQLTVNNTNVTGAGETICIIDTGLDLTHPAFANKILTGYDFYNNDANPQDDAASSHGTHVAGIAAGNDSVKGVAPDARVMPVKVCNSAGGCSGTAILAGIDYCNNNSVAYNIVAISGSLGDGGQYTSANCPSLFDSGLATAVSLGIIPVFASGNNGYSGGVSYPACSPYALSVGAVSKSDGVESYSNRGGDRLDTFAPGTSITSTVIGGSTGSLSGTSMATPHISGIIALIQQNQRAQGKLLLTLAEMRQLLQETGKQVGSWTRADAYAAIAKLDVNYTVNITDSSVTNATPPKTRVAFKETTDLGKFMNCSRLRQNFVHIDSEACPQFNKSAHIVLDGLAGDDAAPLRNGEPCPADVCQNATFVNGTLEFDVIGFSNYSGNSSFDTSALISNCTVITDSSSLTANLRSNDTCIVINASNLFLNCSGFRIDYNTNGSNGANAILVSGQRNVTIQDCVINDANVSGTNGYGIRFTNVNDSRIVNTTVQTNGTGDTIHAVFLFGTSLRNVIANNTLRALGTGTDSYAVALVGSSDFTNVTGNTMYTNGTYGNYGMIINESTTGATISYNVIFTNSSNNQSSGESANHGISIESGAHNITFNNISVDGFGGFNTGIILFSVSSQTIVGNRITTRGGTPNNFGIAFTAATDNLVANNTIIGDGVATNHGIYLASSSNTNVIDGNNVSARPNASAAVQITSGSNNRLTNNVLTATAAWVESFAAGANNNFTNTTFANAAGSIRITGSFVPAGLVNVTQQRLNITPNRAFLNSTNLTALNRSAQITLFNMTATSPLLRSDTNDDGVFEVCAACVQDSYASGTLVFTVPSFTAFTSTEGNVNITLAKQDFPGSIAAGGILNYTITVSVNAGNASNVTLTEQYPAQIIFQNSSPQPTNGNHTFVLGNLTAPRTFAVNITVLVNNATNTFAMDNAANISFVNATGGTVSLSVTESTSVVGTPPPPSGGNSGGSNGGAGGGGGGSSKPKETPTPAPKKTPPPPAFTRDTLKTTSVPQQQSKAVAPQEEQPRAEISAEERYRDAIIDEATARENALTAQKRKKLAVYVIYSTAFAILVSMAIYWVVIHHRRPPSGNQPAQ